MASKGQKFIRHSPDLKEQVLKEHFSTFASPRYLGEKYNISRKTIEMWIRKTKHDIDVKVDHRAGNSGKFRKKNNLTLEDYKERYEILKKYQAFLQARRGKK